MKSLIILLAIGVIGVIGNPVSKQTVTSDNKNPPPFENIESQTKHEETTVNNGNEQKEEAIGITEPAVTNLKKCDDQVDIIIEETVSTDDLSNPVDIPMDGGPNMIDTPSLFDAPQMAIDETPNLIDGVQLPQLPNEFGDFTGSTVLNRDDANAIENEIMQAAAGFVPTPLVFRRKHKPRRRFPTRRHFRPNPFRKKFNFFYPYYGFYRPSSLRFY